MAGNGRAQKSGGGEAAMDLLEEGIQGFCLGQRTIKILWKVASQALKRKQSG